MAGLPSPLRGGFPEVPMKLRTVGLLSMAGMVLTSTTVYSLVPPPRREPGVTPELVDPGSAPGGVDPLASSFETGTTLHVAGRIGHPRVREGSSGDTFVLLEVGAGQEGAAQAG